MGEICNATLDVWPITVKRQLGKLVSQDVASDAKWRASGVKRQVARGRRNVIRTVSTPHCLLLPVSGRLVGDAAQKMKAIVAWKPLKKRAISWYGGVSEL